MTHFFNVTLGSFPKEEKLNVLKWRLNHSQSPVFGLVVFHSTESEILHFRYIKTRGRKIAIEIFFCYTYQHILEIISSK